MTSDLRSILRLEVPVIVQLGERMMNLRDVIDLVPGSIIELPKNADAELELLVNNKTIGCGQAVKVGENFGLRLTFIGKMRDRIAALGEPQQTTSAPPPEPSAEELAAAMLAGQV